MPCEVSLMKFGEFGCFFMRGNISLSASNISEDARLSDILSCQTVFSSAVTMSDSDFHLKRNVSMQILEMCASSAANENLPVQWEIESPENDFEEELYKEDSGFGSGGTLVLSSNSSLCVEDHEILLTNSKQLLQCGFYYPELDSVGAMKLLKKSSIGTFLIRNSLDPRYLFSLSVKTQRGATSVRIFYQNGWFSFDCDERIRKRMPQFNSVLSLVDHHVELSRQGGNNFWRWEEKSGKKNMVVEISRPCRTSSPSLQHLCTLEVNKSLGLLHYKLLHPPFRNNEKLLDCIRNYPFKV